MTREQQKAYNAENYPASVLTWLNEVTDMCYNNLESPKKYKSTWLNEVTDMCYNNLEAPKKHKSTLDETIDHPYFQYAAIGIGLGFVTYITFIRFINPSLTETQLFLEMIGF